MRELRHVDRLSGLQLLLGDTVHIVEMQQRKFHGRDRSASESDRRLLVRTLRGFGGVTGESASVTGIENVFSQISGREKPRLRLAEVHNERARLLGEIIDRQVDNVEKIVRIGRWGFFTRQRA